MDSLLLRWVDSLLLAVLLILIVDSERLMSKSFPLSILKLVEREQQERQMLKIDSVRFSQFGPTAASILVEAACI